MDWKEVEDLLRHQEAQILNNISLGRPAIEGLGVALASAYPSHVFSHYERCRCGKIMKTVADSLGHSWRRYGKRILNDPIFKHGSIYN